jgi:hypothetical protein
MSVQPYKAYYSEQLEKGLEFQDFVTSLFFEMGIAVIQYSSKRYQFERGENSGGIEIKFDDRLEDTGNLYIECAEKSHPDNPYFIPSGIYRMDNSWLYAIGNYRVVYVFLTRHLRWLHKKGHCQDKQIPTSKGFILPEVLAKKYAARTIYSGSVDQMELPL